MENTDLNLMLKAVVSVHVKHYNNQIDYLCDLMKMYNKFKCEDLSKNE